jgi:hypothetical protein
MSVRELAVEEGGGGGLQPPCHACQAPSRLPLAQEPGGEQGPLSIIFIMASAAKTSPSPSKKSTLVDCVQT